MYFKHLYLKNELGEPQFLLLERDYQAKIKLSVKVKEFFGAELRQPLRTDNFKVDLTRDLQRLRGKFGIFHFWKFLCKNIQKSSFATVYAILSISSTIDKLNFRIYVTVNLQYRSEINSNNVAIL